MRFIIAIITTILMSSNIFAQNTNPINIDGFNTEWGNPLAKEKDKIGLSYQMTNDVRNLYLIVQVTDTAIQKQIIRNGFEVWVNKDNKKDKTMGVLYPRPSKTADIVDMPQDSLKLIGFLLHNGNRSMKDSEVRIASHLNDDKQMIYELQIPFNTFYKEKLTEADKKLKFRIGLTIKEPAMTDSDGMGFPPMGMMMMRGPMGGGGGGMRNMQRVMNANPEWSWSEINHWFTYKPTL